MQTQQSQVSREDDSFIHVFCAADMPCDAAAMIFCPNDLGIELYKFLKDKRVEVTGFVGDFSQVDLEVPFFQPHELDGRTYPSTNLIISTQDFRNHLPALLKANFKGIYLAQAFGLTLLAKSRTKHQLKQGQIYDAMVTAMPHPQNDINIFAGDWLSEIPIPGVQAGWNKVLDRRIEWAHEMLGDFNGLNILELGPYEGLHTYALEKIYQAATVTGIEANPRAFLRCLIVKNLFDLKNSRFLLGNFLEYLKQTDFGYDFIYGSGVLYHMADPCDLLQAISKKTKKLFLWTHYYDEDVIQKNTNLNFRFEHDRDRDRIFNGYSYREYCFIYRDGTPTNDHLGGIENYSYWLKADDILGLLRILGFNRIQTGLVDHEHSFGPHFCVTAEK